MASDPNDTGTVAPPLTINAPPGPTGAGASAPDFMISPDDYDALVRTTIGEAGGEPDIGKVAVVHNILNRVASGKYPNTVMGVVTQPNQYESVNTRGAQLAAIPTDSPQYRSAARAVDMAISGQAPDPTNGALNFYAPQLQSDLGRTAPVWAKGPSVQIGRHVFYNGSGVRPPQAAATSVMAASAPAAGGAGGGTTGTSGDLSDDDLDAMLSGRAPTAGGAGGAGGAPAVPGAPSGVGVTPTGAGQGQGGSVAGVGAPATLPASAAPAAASGLSDDDLDAMLSGRGSSAGGGTGELSDADLDAMLSGRAPAAGGAGQGGGAGTPGDLTTHGAGKAEQAGALTPAAGPFGSLNRGAFGVPPLVAPQPPSYLPGADRSSPDPTASQAIPAAIGAGAGLDQVEGTGTAAYDTGAPEDGLTPLQRFEGMPGLGVNMLTQAGQGVPYLRGAVNPLAARLASAITGRSLEDTTATGNDLGAKFETEHPVLTMAARIAGGAAAMGPLAEAAPWAFGLQKGGSLATRMLTSGGANALLGYTDAEVNGEDPFGGGYLGNALRYGLGFAAPLAGGVAGGTTKGTGNALGAVYDRAANLATGSHTWSGVDGYGSAAVNYALDKIAADGGVTAMADRLRQLGPEGMMADTGPSTQGIVGGLSTRPGDAKSVTADALATRHAGRTTRILSDVENALGPAQSPTPWRQAVEDASGAVTAPYFARAYENGAPWTPDLNALTQRPAIRNALTEAGTAAENRGAPLPVTTLDAAGNPAAATAPMQALEAGQRPAVTAALADALGVDPAAGPLAIGDRIAAARSAAADPAYQAYRSMPATTSLEIAELLSRPSGRAAVAVAERKAADQGRSIYVPQPAPEAPPAPTPRGSADIPDPFEGLGQGPGTLGPTGTGFSADGPATLGSGIPQRPTGPAPVSLLSFLQRTGVQDPGGDLRSMGLDRFPGLIREGGLTLDRAREAAAEAGYLGGDTAAAMRNTTPNDLMDAMASHPAYSVHDEDAVAARKAWADYQASRGGPTPHDLAAESVRSHLVDSDVPASSIDPDTLDLAAHFHAGGMDPGEAWEAAAMADPFPGDLPPAQREASAGPTEPATPPPRDITPEGLDYVHRALGDKVAAALRGSDPRPDDARIIGGLQDELRTAMENHPNAEVGAAYAAARRAYAGPSREIEALDLGRRAYGDNVTREQAGRDFGGLRTDGERQQFRQGFYSAAAEKLARKSDGANFVDTLAGNQAFRDKLATVAASPDALGRFGGALDLARQRFTEATRPNAQALHAALDTLDAKVARGADDGVTAARNALAAHLGQDPGFARGRELQGSYNLLTGALDDGATALRSGPNAIHPDDFAARFAARTPAGQAAERIAMRDQVDRALGSKPNDLLALRSTLQGEDGWNGRKIAAAFGEDAGNALTKTVAREETFGETHALGVKGSHSERLKGAAEDLKQSTRGSRDLSQVNGFGAIAQITKTLLYDWAKRALFDTSTAPRDLELARMLVEQGDPRDAAVAQLGRLEARRAAISGNVNALANTVRTGTNLLLSAGAPSVVAAAGGTQSGREAELRMRKAGAGVRAAGNALFPSLIDPPPRNALTGAR